MILQQCCLNFWPCRPDKWCMGLVKSMRLIWLAWGLAWCVLDWACCQIGPTADPAMALTWYALDGGHCPAPSHGSVCWIEFAVPTLAVPVGCYPAHSAMPSSPRGIEIWLWECGSRMNCSLLPLSQFLGNPMDWIIHLCRLGVEHPCLTVLGPVILVIQLYCLWILVYY